MSIYNDKNSNQHVEDEHTRFLQQNLKGLMQDMLEWMEERNAQLREGGEFTGTPAEAKLFAVLRGRRRTISELARSLGVSRQAVHTTLKRLIHEGVLETVPHPDNQRDKLVQVTAKGQQVRKMAARNIRQIEAEVAQSIGEENMERMRELLLEHLANVRGDAPSEGN